MTRNPKPHDLLSTALVTESDGQTWIVAVFNGTRGPFEAVYHPVGDRLMFVCSYPGTQGHRRDDHEFWGGRTIQSATPYETGTGVPEPEVPGRRSRPRRQVFMASHRRLRGVVLRRRGRASRAETTM